MPISVEYLRNQVNSLAKKDQAGYSTDAEFNQSLQSAQTLLYEYYYKQFEATGKIHDALETFIKEIPVTLTGGSAPLPTDEFHRLEVSYRLVLNDCATPQVSIVPVDYMQTNEEAYILSSPIRKPDVNKKIIRHTYKNGRLYVYPITVTEVNYKYLRKPGGIEVSTGTATASPPFYASTLTSNANGDFRVFDPINSIDLEWAEQETNNFLDLLLFDLGIELRSSAILEYVRLKQQEGLVR